MALSFNCHSRRCFFSTGAVFFLSISLWASPAAWHATLGNLYGVSLDNSVRSIPSPGLISFVNWRKLSVIFRRDGEAGHESAQRERRLGRANDRGVLTHICVHAATSPPVGGSDIRWSGIHQTQDDRRWLETVTPYKRRSVHPIWSWANSWLDREMALNGSENGEL